MADYVPSYTFTGVILCLQNQRAKIDTRIDLRVLYCPDTKRFDISVGEFAKKAIKSKLYNDR
ncbi:unnamed protein product [Mucor hiemalis]